MADTSPRRPYPGQSWKHGWQPVTAAAKASKGKQGNPEQIKARLAEAREAALSKSTSGAGASWAKGKTTPGSSKGSSAPSKAAGKTVAPKTAPAKPAAKAPAKTSAPSSQKTGSGSTAQQLDDAKAAIKAGQNAKAVNILTQAMRNAGSKQERDAIGKVRNDLASKVMGKKEPAKSDDKAAKESPKPKTEAPAEDDDPGLPAGVAGIDGSGNMLSPGDRVEAMSGDHDGEMGKVLGRNADGSLNVDFGDGPVKVRGGELKQRPAAKEAPKAPAKTEAPKPAAKKEAPEKPSGESVKDDKPAPDQSGQSVSDDEVEDSIHDALNSLSKGEGKWNTMTALRDALKGIPRDQQDRVLKKMVLSHQIDLVPAAISGNLKPEDHEAALQLPSGPNHQIRVNALAPKRQRTTPVKKAEPAPDSGQRVPDSQVESSVKDALKDYPEGKWSSMTALRKKLSGIPRNQQDDVIRQMMLDGIVDIEPVAIYGDLKQEDRDAEIMIGPKPNHQIRLSRR